jgi:hypothetical protein
MPSSLPDRSTEGIEFLDRTSRAAGEVMPAPRLSSLRGKQLGFLDNSQEKADVFLVALAERLSQGFPLADLIHRRKPTYSRLAPPSLMEGLSKTCDGVITAMGA